MKNKIKLPLGLGITTALLCVILGAIVIIFPPNYYRFTSLPAMLLGFGYVIPFNLNPLLSIPTLGCLGLVLGITIELLWKWKIWLKSILIVAVPLLLMLNIIGFTIWAYGNVEGHW